MSYFGTVDPNRYTEPHGSVNYSIFYDENTPIPGASASAAMCTKGPALLAWASRSRPFVRAAAFMRRPAHRTRSKRRRIAWN